MKTANFQFQDFKKVWLCIKLSKLGINHDRGNTFEDLVRLLPKERRALVEGAL
jgi:hypothetical protein